MSPARALSDLASGRRFEQAAFDRYLAVPVIF
jgi:hypothetical protein